MAILSTGNWLSEQRADISDMRRVESAVRNDFDTLVTSAITGTSQGYVIRGFSILTAGAIGSPANGLQMVVDPGAILHIAASVSGTIFQTPIGTPNQVLSAATNTNVSGSFSASSTNYVGIDYNRFADPSTNVTKYIWNASANDEITTIAPAAQTLTFKVIITTSVWAANVLPVAIVTTDSNGNVVSITDARWMLFSLETGGISPNPSHVYPWSAGRTQPPVTSTSDSVDPFTGGDKQIADLKDFIDAVETTFLEIKGTPYWFSGSGGGGPIPTLQSLFQDLGNTVITGSGEISNGILPNSDPLLMTTGNITAGSNQLTSLASVAGLVNGDFVFGTGISTGTTIISISGSTITLSQVASFNGTGIAVTFYSPSVITTPGQINWNDPISIRVIGSSLTYTIAANPSSSDITLANDQVAYITLVRNVAITPNLIFTTGSPTVVSVGAVTWTTGLLPGDQIKIASNPVSGYYQILTVDSASQVTLTTSVLAPDNTGAVGAQAQYAFGSYLAAPTPTTNRNIYITSRETVPVGANVFWLFLREDNGGNPRVYIRFLSMELDNGESVAISGTTSLELLKYIGSPNASDSSPQYSSAINPGSLAQITHITIGAASTITSNQYFTINSAGNNHKYYVWFKKDGTGTSPAPLNLTGIEVDITTGQTSTQVATLLAAALNSLASGDFSAVSGAGTVIVTSASSGISTAAANVNVGAPFAISITQSGTGIANQVVHNGDSLTLAIAELDLAIGDIDEDLTPPAELIAQSPPSLVVGVGPGTVINSVTLENRTLPLIANVAVNFAGGSITFPSTSGTITVSPGVNAAITIGANQFVAVLVQLDASGNLNLVVGAPAGSLGAVVVPGSVGSSLAIGYIVVHSDGSGVIQPIGSSSLYQFVGGGGGNGLYTQATLLNNQVSPVDIAGFLIDPTVYNAFSSEYSISRRYSAISASISDDATYYSNLTATGDNSGFSGGGVLTSALQSNGASVLGGSFTNLNSLTRNRLVRVASTGTEDTTFAANVGTGFSPGGGGVTNSVVVQSDQKIVVGGSFTDFKGSTRNRLVRLNTDGTEDTTFYTNLGTAFGGVVKCVLIQSDQKIVVGGSFTDFKGNTKHELVRLNTDGTEDTTFYSNLTATGDNSGFSGFGATVTALALQSDQKIIVVGSYNSLNGNSRNHIVRLNTDGTEDSTFYTNTSGGFSSSSPSSVIVQSDQKIVVSGNGSSGAMVRYTTTGAPDTAFNSNIGSFVASLSATGPNILALQADQKILVGGPFDTYNGNSRNYLIRLNTDGTEDTAFYTALGTAYDSTVGAISVQTDGNIIVGGIFSMFNGNIRNELMRLDIIAAVPATEEVTQGVLRGIYENTSTAWVLGGNEIDNGVANAGVTFSMTALGQLQYTSTNISGTLVVSQMRYIIGSKL